MYIYIYNLVLDQILQKYADQLYQLVLLMTIINIFKAGYAVRHVHMYVFQTETGLYGPTTVMATLNTIVTAAIGTVYRIGCEPIDHFHRVQAHIHPHQCREVLVLIQLVPIHLLHIPIVPTVANGSIR